MTEQLRLLPAYLGGHLELALPALLLAAAVSVPLGVAVARRRRLEASVLGAAGVIQTIPGLALLAVMVPALAALGAATRALWGLELRSIGYVPAFAALTLYALLPILRNTVTGIVGLDPALIEAAQGVGMTPRQQLLRVELPLALPVIVAGVRTAAVWVVGTATLSTAVGATSLGNYIFAGLQTRNLAAVLVGCAAAAALALLLDGAIRALERGIQQRRRRPTFAALAALLALAALPAASRLPAASGAGRPVAIGSKTFTEQYVLSELLAQRIAARTGLPTRSVPSLGSSVVFDALRSGDIDVYVDYSGTIWATVMGRGSPPADRTRVLDEVGRFLSERYGITVVGALGFENTYALGMRAERARTLSVRMLSELASVAPRLEIGGDYEFFQRPEWRALERTYGLRFRALRSMDPALMYEALDAGQVDVISAYSSDGRLASHDVALLEDDRGVIPPYDAIVLVAPRVPHERPEVVEALRGLVGAVDAGAMRRMNLAVDGEGRAPAEVAREFLARLGE